MYTKVIRFFRPLMLWLFIAMIGMPIGLLLTVENAQAAEKITAEKIPIEKTKPVVEPKMEFVSQAGLFRGNTYAIGQSIHIRLTISGNPVSVWAETGPLDANFKENMAFSSLGQGDWDLATPKLSSNLNFGSNFLKIYAKNASGKTIETRIKLTLIEFPPVKIVSYKVSGQNVATINWNPINYADAYQVNWQIQGDNSSNLFRQIKDSKIEIENLTPGTIYEVRIQVLRGDSVGEATKVVFKTLGESPIKPVLEDKIQVNKIQETKTITPRIDRGVAIEKKVASATEKVTENANPSPEPSVTSSTSPSPKEEEATGGWSKLLIALSILIIAVGAALGGYYGYEWLMRQKEDKDSSDKDSSDRW